MPAFFHISSKGYISIWFKILAAQRSTFSQIQYVPIVSQLAHLLGFIGGSKATVGCKVASQAVKQYTCPEGEPLKQFCRSGSDPNRDTSDKGVAK